MSLFGQEKERPANFRVVLGWASRGENRFDETIASFSCFNDAYKIYKEYRKTINETSKYDIVLLDLYVKDGSYDGYITVVMYSHEQGQFTPK